MPGASPRSATWRRARRNAVRLAALVGLSVPAGGGRALASVWSDDDRRYLEAVNRTGRDDDRAEDGARRGSDDGKSERWKSGGTRSGSRDDRDADPCGTRCFLRGTLIRIPGGLRRVEDLRPGDRVATITGVDRAIETIEARRIERSDDGWPASLGPVRIRPGALGAHVPRRDLWLTAAHAIHFDGVLVPVEALVNGLTILRDEVAHAVSLDYFHIALDRHDVIEAEGVACESLRLPGMQPCGPLVGLGGRRAEIASRLRSVLSPVVDRRRPFDRLRDLVEDRAAG